VPSANGDWCQNDLDRRLVAVVNQEEREQLKIKRQILKAQQ
jgi:hypothetical protein